MSIFFNVILKRLLKVLLKRTISINFNKLTFNRKLVLLLV